MLVQKKISSGRKTFSILAIIVLVAVIAYLLYSNFIARRVVLVQPLDVKVNIVNLPKVNPQLSTDFLTKDPYTRLRDAGTAPSATATGRDNPFQAITFYAK